MSITIKQAVSQMLQIVEQLQESYPRKKFTLDGRLIGDIGEILVADAYDVELFEDVKKQYDGKTGDGHLVQIKATMKDTVSFPVDSIPDYFLAIKINLDGTFREVFNGPGRIASETVKNRQRPKTNFHVVNISALTALNEQIAPAERVRLRPERDSE